MTAPLYTVSFIESGWPQQFVILFSDITCDSYDGVGLWNRSLDTWGEEEEQKERLTLFAEPCILGAPQAQMVALFCWGVLYRLAPQVGQVVKNPPVNAGDIRDMGSIPGLGRSPGEGNGNPLQYFWLENPMDRGAWHATIHGVTKSQTWLKWLSMCTHWPSSFSP